MTENVRICELNWMEYERRLREEPPVVMLPVGSLEQHGPHLPMHCDSLIPTAICEGAAARVGGLVAPTISYGYKSQPKSGGGNHFPGTTSLDAQTLIFVVRDVIKEFARHGVRKMALMDGHYENNMFLVEGIDDLGASTGVVELMLADYRFVDDSLDFILDEWVFLELTGLGIVSELRFDFESSDVGLYGINTPTYFAIDNLITIPEPGHALLIGLGLMALATHRRETQPR